MFRRAICCAVFEVLLSDINGIWRGLGAPDKDREKLLAEGVSFPRSLYAMRFDGGVAESAGIGIASGDPDYPCVFLPETAKPAPWRKNTTQAVAEMNEPDGAPFYASPRRVLAAVVEKLAGDGMRPLLAAELEFYLTDGAGIPDAGEMPELYSPDAMARHEDFFTLLEEAAAAQDVELGARVSEYAPGQFEVNLRHKEPLRACLEALLFRRLARECARAVGKRATFMAKPRGGISGSGMHFHASIAGAEGEYYLASAEKRGAAVAGALSVLAESAAFFAPFGNSYRRFVPGNYAPVSVCWGEEDRAAAVRVPRAAAPAENRLELRTAGADANPYLVAAALLAGMHRGLVRGMNPPKPSARGAPLPATWHAALRHFSRAKILPEYIDRRFLRLYLRVKWEEYAREAAHVGDYDTANYGRVL